MTHHSTCLAVATLTFGLVLSHGVLAAPPQQASFATYDAHTVTGDGVRDGLERVGYRNVDVLERRGQIYEVRARYDGRPVRLKVDTQSGHITDMAARPAKAGLMPTRFSAQSPHETDHWAVANELRRLGFRDVEVTGRRGNFFEAEARYDGKPVRLRIDVENGLITDMAAKEDDDGDLPLQARFSVQDPYQTDQHAVANELERLGYDDVSVTDRRGAVFDADATWRGAAMSLQIDAESGRITVQ